MDANGRTLTTDIGQGTLLNNGLADVISLGAWSFSGINPGKYTVTAKLIPGYTISHTLCMNCSFPNPAYTSGNMVTVNLPRGGNYVNIYFKYKPVSTQSSNHRGGNGKQDDDDDHEREGDDPFSNFIKYLKQRINPERKNQE